MPSPNATPTPITPPRVPLIDPRTGLIDRAWYLFFLSLNNAATNIYDNPDVGPSSESLLASYDAALRTLADEVGTQPVPADFSVELTKQIEAAGLSPYAPGLLSQVAEMQKQIDALNVLPPPAQGTVTAVTATAPVVSSGGTMPDISMPAADITTNGYLTSTDWNTFNSKQPAGSYVTLTGTETLQNKTLDNTNTVTLLDTLFTLQDNLDSTKQAQFQLSGITTGTTRTYTLPNLTGSLATIGTLTQTFSGTTTFSAATVTVGSSTAASTYGFGTGATISGSTKAVNIATGGVSGSTTTVTFGSTFGTTTTFNGQTKIGGSFGRGAPVTKTANFTLADTENWLINNKSGSTCTVTLPAASSWVGREITFKNMQAQTLVSASSNVVPIDSTSAGTAILLAVAGNWATMVSDGTNWVIMQQAANNCLLLE